MWYCVAMDLNNVCIHHLGAKLLLNWFFSSESFFDGASHGMSLQKSAAKKI